MNFLVLPYYLSTVQKKILSCSSNIMEGESDPKSKLNIFKTIPQARG